MKPARLAGEPQPRRGASMIVYTSEPIATVAASSPARSSGAASASRDSGTTRHTTAAASSATGTSARNTLGHENTVSSRPPLTGPIATPSPVTAPHTPTAFARSRRSGNVLLITASVVGKISAAKAPITKRAATSSPGEVQSAAATLAAAKPSSPAISAGRRPKRSPRLPAESTSAANARL